jgi:acyl-coenzyme A synthetase/AMP-(fatty) acid ligase
VPSALVLMQQVLGRHDVRSLRHVIFAGEVLPKPQLRALAGRLGGAALTNLYGPTETNVCTFHRVEPADLDDDGPLPIGRAIDATRLWVVGEGDRPVDGAEKGELLVAGPTVCAGYLGDAELTARRLVPAPDGQGLAYRTGDLVSRRADGVLLFHGRADRMLKCRGYRIEPGEIEAVLARHPAIEESAVVAVGEPSGEQQLKAFVVAATSGPASTAYMLPELWEYLERLPRNERGKVDVQALLARRG